MRRSSTFAGRRPSITLAKLCRLLALAGVALAGPLWFRIREFSIYLKRTQLCAAAQLGDVARLKVMLDAGVSPNVCWLDNPALWWAVHGGQLEAVTLLLDRGARPGECGRWGTPTGLAIQCLGWRDGKPRHAIAELLMVREALSKSGPSGGIWRR
jgi:hypothetical protein